LSSLILAANTDKSVKSIPEYFLKESRNRI
jgi:hypothetical protein